MTFNEGMRIDTSTTSTGGGGGGRGIALGGGIGGLAIVLLALFLGVDPGPVINQMPTGPAQSSGPTYDLTKCRTGADANAHVECRVVATGNSVDGVWQQLLRGYRRPQMKLFKGQIQTGCGAATSDVGPFYCPADQTAYFDTDFFQVLKTQFGSSGGPLAQEYVVAHEYGHHVQNLLGDLERAQKGAQGAQGGGVRSELQADCYAGVWAHYASTTKQQGTDVTYLQPLTDKDIADALSAASSVGDDRIQKETTGRVNPERWTHGSSEQRQKWFTVGYQTGDPNKCDTFSARDLN
ncbi:MAG TPA: neutral zinc metallopeptidase [Mycobacterium sp.]|uniref:KPN_02809 family neutral zinc metallopeptidase n=1 Tax=Mycolicibacterium sp. TaxID=2320850 RepID=UPI0025CCEFF6|nr:neutral zinc metallopeptidase [Mycolicibacterium sp.]HPX35394.1 neutral zinc metallopeptidase [Mycobacterium sp.]HQC76847.1 neutral zinc metallopeptidase [Mycobacterium sp.]